MNHTEHLQLSQWEKTDRIMMDDFNSDNAKIDEMAGKVEVLWRVMPDLTRYMGQVGALAARQERNLGSFSMVCNVFRTGAGSASGEAAVDNGVLRLTGANKTGGYTSSSLIIGRSSNTETHLWVRADGGKVTATLNGQPMESRGAAFSRSSTGESCLEYEFVWRGAVSQVQVGLTLETGSESAMRVFDYSLFVY